MDTNEIISVFFDAIDGLTKVEHYLWVKYLEAESEDKKNCAKEFDEYYGFSLQKNEMLKALDFLLVRHRRRGTFQNEITKGNTYE